ncbi:KipI family sensor histidine kinase inhibitor [Kineococcus xinjiangensis]|uniref:KipI family sensor histidine kinase inhibitor n=1 Tax=Kineococcus xinjiangensis TaxID=512762 RepID=A0A2S6IG13_9ACTN|nr:KipI family sensor histidine kinase inhibitor [Kineococcus xinjiangensis]
MLPCGDAALLVELGSLPAALALHADLAAAPPPGVVDVVPAARTVLVRTAPGADLAALAGLLAGRAAPTGAAAAPAPAPAVELRVVYDGEDLAEVGELTGLGAAGVVAAHTASTWTTAFTGFAPGFGYLTGGDPRLHVPRRSSPRTRVPAGSVALAGEFSGVYPRTSPGGWQLIGTCDAVLFDPDRDPPALLRPGTRVRFTDAGTAAP